MAHFRKISHKYFSYQLGRNQITLKGFENLIKGIWPKLETLDFGNIEQITQEKQEEFDYCLQQKFDFPSLKSLRIGLILIYFR